MPLSTSIIQQLNKTYKESSLKQMMSRMKQLTSDAYIDEDYLKGKIKEIHEEIQKRNYKNNKVYYNTLHKIYSLCNYDKSELAYLEELLKGSQEQCDNARKVIKDSASIQQGMKWDDLQSVVNSLKDKVCDAKSARDYLLGCFYSDEAFGPKRIIDIVKLRYKDLIDNEYKIKFTAEKNNFEYESQVLSMRLIEAIEMSRQYTSSPFIIYNLSGNLRVPANTATKALSKALGKFNVQYIRLLWASYKAKVADDYKELIHHAYELNHSTGMHLDNYCLKYPEDPVEDDETIQVIATYKFKKVVTYKRI
ncbi:TPA_asm: yRec [Monosiga MELD virus 2]|nr:TPA_asm: yRec [Monosiga MELD virus 2]